MLFNFLFTSACLSWVLTASTAFTWLRSGITTEKNALQTAKQEGQSIFPETYVWLPLLKFFDGIYNCAGCMGFWLGLGWFQLYFPWDAIQCFSHGIMACGASLIFTRLIKFLNK